MAKNTFKKMKTMKEGVTDEQLLKEVEKIECKIEVLEGIGEELNHRIASISEEVGDLRRMIRDKEQSQKELEINFEKVRDAVEQIEPLKIVKGVEKLSAEIEKTSARVERNEQLFRNFDEEIKKVREVLSRFKSFENLVDLEKKVNEKVSKIEKAERYTERIVSKAEGIFADLNEKLLALKDKLDTITKVDNLIKNLVKEIDQLSLKLEKDVMKTEDLNKLKQSLEKKIEEETGLLEAKVESRVNEIANEIPAQKDYNAEDINRIKELATSIKGLEGKINRDFRIQSREIEKIKNFFTFFLEKTSALDKRVSVMEKKLTGFETLMSKINRIEGNKEALINTKIEKNALSINMLENQLNKITKTLISLENKISKAESLGSKVETIMSSLNKNAKENEDIKTPGNQKTIDTSNDFAILFTELKKHRQVITKTKRKLKEVLDEVRVLKDRIERLETKKSDYDDVEKLKVDLGTMKKRLEEIVNLLLERSVE